MDSELWATIRRLHLIERLSRRAIARRLNLHRWTVTRALTFTEGPPPDVSRRGPMPSKLDPFKPYITERLAVYPDLPSTVLFREIREQGYPGQIAILWEYLRRARPAPSKAFLRLETLPGDYAQVDWAHVGSLVIGNRTWRVSCFVMVLSYSRMLYLEFTLSQTMEAFLTAHVHAFEFFKGVPKKINYDNLKTVVLSRAGRDIRFHPRFMDLAGHYLFEPVPCNVRAAWEKGKVESAVKFVRSAFLAGRALTELAALNEQARAWRDDQANVRRHGTLGERPIDRFAQEAERLQTLPVIPYDPAVIKQVGVSRQALVRFDGNRYSVPSDYAGKSLTLKAHPHGVELYDGVRPVATHARCYERHRILEDPAHVKDLLLTRKKAHASRLHNDFLALAPECRAYLAGLVAAELDLHAHLDKIMELISLYGKTEVAGAVAHALAFKAFGAGYIQRVIQQRRAARDMPEPQPIVLTKKPDWNRLAVEQTDLSIYDDLYEGPRE